MPGYGRNVIAQTGIPIKVSADGAPFWHPGGITINWTTVAAVSGSAVTTPEGFVVPVGAQWLRFGQVMTMITATGWYGPYDTAAGDGRQLLLPGRVVLLDQSIFQAGIPGLGFTTTNTVNVGAIDGGLVYKGRIIQSGVGTHSLAAGPTFAELCAAMPTLRYVESVQG